jgi:hypothetical protein
MAVDNFLNKNGDDLIDLHLGKVVRACFQRRNADVHVTWSEKLEISDLGSLDVPTNYEIPKWEGTPLGHIDRSTRS